jgi:hypothetical protein
MSRCLLRVQAQVERAEDSSGAPAPVILRLISNKAASHELPPKVLIPSEEFVA